MFVCGAEAAAIAYTPKINANFHILALPRDTTCQVRHRFQPHLQNHPSSPVSQMEVLKMAVISTSTNMFRAGAGPSSIAAQGKLLGGPPGVGPTIAAWAAAISIPSTYVSAGPGQPDSDHERELVQLCEWLYCACPVSVWPSRNISVLLVSGWIQLCRAVSRSRGS